MFISEPSLLNYVLFESLQPFVKKKHIITECYVEEADVYVYYSLLEYEIGWFKPGLSANLG